MSNNPRFSSRSPGLAAAGRAVLCIACALACPQAAPACRAVEPASSVLPSDAAEVIAKVRAALGIGSLSGQRCLDLTASGTLLGAPSESRLLVDASGRFARQAIGSIELGAVFDGTNVWTRDLGGEVYRAVAGDRRDAMLNAYCLSGWFFSPACTREITLDQPGQPTDAPVLLIATDPGRALIRVTVEPATWLPRSWSVEESGNVRSIEIAEWRDQSGLRVPARASLSAEGMSDTFNLTSAELLDQAPPDAFDKPTGDPTHATFDPALPAELAVERTPTGHLLVKASINGQDCGWFIFDTGAGINCVSKTVAQRLALAQIGSVPARGVGGVTHSPLFRPGSLSVGPMTLHDGLLMQLDLSFLTLRLGREISGIVGFGFLARAVAEIDMGNARIALYDPADYTLDAGAWTDLEIMDRVPAVHATFDRGQGLFRLDTGANTALTFHAPTVERMKLLDQRQAIDTKLGGVGGAISAKAATLDWLTIGEQRLERISATFALENKGAFANPDIDGNIGAGILRNFRLVFDYPHERMAFIKR
jgi:hypothetical protein